MYLKVFLCIKPEEVRTILHEFGIPLIKNISLDLQKKQLESMQNKLLSYISGLGIAFSSNNKQLINYMKSMGKRK